MIKENTILKDIPLPNLVDGAKIGLYAFLLIGIYFSGFTWLIKVDWARDDYNYAYLIPIVVLYLLWEKRQKLASISNSPTWIGIIALLSGICLFWVGELSGEFLTIYISSWIILVGICWMQLGWKKIKIIAFPLIFLITMFPLPNFLYYKITVTLQLLSSQLGVALIRLYGMSAFREGNVIDLGFTQLQVVEACSGLRYLISLFVLGLLMAYFFRAALWKRAILFLSVIPLSIFTNSFRIAVTGILYELFGAKVAEGFFHGFSGVLIFLFCLPILLIEMWVLRAIGTGHSVKNDDPAPVSIPKPHPHGSIKDLLSPHFVVTAILLGATLVLSQGIEFREKIPIKKPLNQFPLDMGEWSGVRETMDQKFIDTLDLNDYVMIDYRLKDGKSVNFYVAYYESQRKGESIHSPESCLPGSGWVFEQAGQKTLPMPGYEKGPFLVNRAYMQKGVYRQLSYYWFSQRGRILTNAYQLKLFVFWDALTKQRTDGALVRLITPVGEYEKLEDAEARLQAFAGKIVPILDQYIPGKEMGG